MDFEGLKSASLAEWNGVMDSMHVNPAPDAVNTTSMCAKYIRDTATYDNFKIFPYTKLIDVTPYASSGATSKITLKLYTSAPVGSPVNIQLGIRSNTTYPAGIHSVYYASTTAQNAWQTLTFNYLMSPAGSSVQPTDVDKIVVFFRPNTHNRDTIYFDEPNGPQESIIGIKENSASQNAFRLFQNKPNPAKESTRITFQLNTGGHVNLKIYDILGKAVSNIIDQDMNEGSHSVDIETAGMPAGVYFYELNNNGVSRSSKMIVTK